MKRIIIFSVNIFFLLVFFYIAILNSFTCIITPSYVAKQQLREIEKVVSMYVLERSHFPINEKEFLSIIPKWKRAFFTDPWENSFHYIRDNEGYKIISYGADGKLGGIGEDQDIIYEYKFSVLHNIKIDGKISELTQLLKNPDVDVRKAAVESLKNLVQIQSNKEVILTLIQSLNDSNVDVRKTIVYSLGEIIPVSQEVISAIVNQSLNDKDDRVREASIYSLRNIGTVSQEVIFTLIQALNDPKVCVRKASAYSLGNIGIVTKEIIFALLQALNDPDERVRKDSVYSLGNITPVTKEIILALIQALNDPDKRVREAAVDILEHIDLPSSIPIDIQKSVSNTLKKIHK